MKVMACLWDDLKGAAIDILNECDLESVFFVGAEEPDSVRRDFKIDPDVKLESWEYWDLRFGWYNDVDWNSIPPLGEDDIIEMSDDEAYVMEMMERDAVIYSGVGPHDPKGFPDEHFEFADNKYFTFNRTYQQRKRAYLRHLRYWKHFFDTNDIDLMICPTVPHVAHFYIIFRLAWRRGIKTIMLTHTSIPARKVSIYDFTQGPPGLKETYDRKLLELKDKGIDEIELGDDGQSEYDRITADSEAQKMPWYRYRPFDKPKGPRIASRVNDKISGQGAQSFIKKLVDPDYWHFRLKGLNRPQLLDKKLFDYYDSLAEGIVEGERYIYVPLHVQPEMTSMPLGGFYSNQQLLIELIASIIPDDWKVYVKENIRQTRFNRDVEFYRDLAALPNVRMMSRTQSTFELMESCEAVATVTGTAAWEALFKGKHAIMFGFFTTMYAPGAYYVNSAEDLRNALKDMQDSGPPDPRELKIFLQALEEVSIRVSRSDKEKEQFEIDQQENEQRIAQEFIRRIKQLDIKEVAS